MRFARSAVLVITVALVLAAQNPSPPTRLIIVDPGHFHAALLQKEMYAGLAKQVSVYSKLGPELIDYLNRISLFNNRTVNPTSWQLDVHTSEDPMGAMLRDRAGDAVVYTGRNRIKIDRILAALGAGLNVLADKPWIISSSDMPKLERALEIAESKGLVAYDIMTERHEVTCELQRELVNAPELFGRLVTGSAGDPAIRAKSIHHVMKVVAGVPLRRPPWFFDIQEYGEGLADVGTHVVDLVQWTAFPDQAIDYRRDIQMLSGRRWPLEITRDQFRQVTGEQQFTADLRDHVRGETFRYMCNNAVHYTIRGARVELDIVWKWEAAQGGDVYEAVFRGTNARVEIRQGAAEKFVPELYVVPADQAQARQVFAALRKTIGGLASRWPGLAVNETGAEARIAIPEKYRTGHEAHFAQVSNRFFGYLRSPKSVPPWERPGMLAKYWVSTKGVELGYAQR